MQGPFKALILVLAATSGSAFHAARPSLAMSLNERTDPYQPFAPVDFGKIGTTQRNLGAAAFTTLPLMLGVQEAAAKGGEYGAWEHKAFALVHPVIMGSLFLATFYAGYTGLQWRSVRTIAEDIKRIKDEGPKLSTGSIINYPVAPEISKLKASLANMQDKEGEQGKKVKSNQFLLQYASIENDIKILESTSVKDTEKKIVELTQKRKDLLAGDFRDKHSGVGALILAMGVGIAIEGPVNTFIRTGKLFPGPHLYVGAVCTALWALAAALTPAMQRGNDAARAGHIALNGVNLALFAWQVNTGFGILEKVWEKVQW